ncbi:MAG: hypothetical protein KF761_13410 [Salinibacterium sp.]|nr:hypothetical protein [Salinibacterium sp.]
MTIALLIKVNDGIVLASDSASTLGGGAGVLNTYNNANKVFNLHKALPIGAMTWGLGNVGPSSIATISKDMREHFHAGEGAWEPWRLDSAKYSVEAVANQVRDYLSDRYSPVAAEHALIVEAAIKEDVKAGVPEDVARMRNPLLSELGFLVAGYSSEADESTAYAISVGPTGPPVMVEVLPSGETGAQWWGQPEAIARIMNGISLGTPDALVNLGIGGLDANAAQEIANGLRGQLGVQMIAPPMPIQDAIDLAEFLVSTTIQFVRFTPGPPTVGGPIEIATITKHEGFRWVRRKHFFDSRINPPFGGHGHAEHA